MISLCKIDAAFRRVRDDSPDLDIGLLSLDERDVHWDDHNDLFIETARIRSALVARVADTGMHT